MDKYKISLLEKYMSIEIIAELAQGFEGKPEQAKLLMLAASKAKADAVKYQLVYADELATTDYEYHELFQSLEMPDEVWHELASYAKQLKIKLQFDIFGEKSLKLAEEVKVDTVKLHGTDIANIGLLNKVSFSTIKRVILGAGGAFLSELERALDILNDKEVVVLFGYQGYPTPIDTNQISRIQLFKHMVGDSRDNVIVGFADHAEPDSELSYAIAATSIGAGAKVIEKHLTLGKTMELEDHESALNPDEFLIFSETVRNCAKAYEGAIHENDFGMSDAEYNYRKLIRRHVVSVKNLSKNTIIKHDDVGLKRTSSESFLTDIESVYNKVVLNDIQENAPILPESVK
ncbi:MAG: sialic acid synthase SpsE [Enterobacterales bacterium]